MTTDPIVEREGRWIRAHAPSTKDGSDARYSRADRRPRIPKAARAFGPLLEPVHGIAVLGDLQLPAIDVARGNVTRLLRARPDGTVESWIAGNSPIINPERCFGAANAILIDKVEGIIVHKRDGVPRAYKLSPRTDLIDGLSTRLRRVVQEFHEPEVEAMQGEVMQTCDFFDADGAVMAACFGNPKRTKLLKKVTQAVSISNLLVAAVAPADRLIITKGKATRDNYKLSSAAKPRDMDISIRMGPWHATP